jgi:hypothetical protein
MRLGETLSIAPICGGYPVLISINAGFAKSPSIHPLEAPARREVLMRKGRDMKPIVLGAAITLMTALSAARGDVPFASALLATPRNCNPLALPGLGEIMILTQLRQIKLS